MKVTVKPIDREKWHKKVGKESFTSPKFIQAKPSIETMKYEVGLTEKELRDLKKKVSYDLSTSFVRDQAHPFWDSVMGKVELKNATKVYDTERPIEQIAIGIMKANPAVANSQAEFEEGLWPDATHVIFSEEEENEIAASKIQLKRKATIESAKLSDAKKAQIVIIIAGVNVKGKDSNTIEVEFDKVLKKDPAEVLRLISGDEEERATRALVLEALQKSVLRKKGVNIMYHDAVIASSIEGAVEYLNDEENQEFKLRITSAIQ